MREIIKSSQLVTVENVHLHGSKIVNIDSLSVERVKRFLRIISASMGYEEAPSHKEISKELGIIPYFRGFPLENLGTPDVANFFEKFFVVGEKGAGYREDVLESGISQYFKQDVTEEDLILLTEEINKILLSRRLNIIKIEALLSCRDDQLSVEGMYTILLNFLHNVGGRWKDKKRSPFVSAAQGYEAFSKAEKFALGKEDRSIIYILWGFTKVTDSENYIKTSELTNFMRKIGVDWYDDIHSEIIIKDAIFPQKIFGVFEIDSSCNKITFIINPYLYQLFSSREKNSTDIAKYVSENGIPVDQENFETFASDIGYQSYGYDDNSEHRWAGTIGAAANIKLPKNYLFR